MQEYVLTLRCPDGPGIVHAVTSGLLQVKSNILEQAQFTEPNLGVFCLRTRFECPEDDVEVVRAAIAQATDPFNPAFTLRPRAELTRAVVMVSKFDHCLVDLLYRVSIGEIPLDIRLVVSNHRDTEPIAERHGIEFRHIPVDASSKSAAEAELMRAIDSTGCDLVVLARYMQVLSDDFCSRMPGRIINIHHSFLPGFKGAKPYHQAYERGVKIIGATAHFVTSDLDEGPIIEQDVQRVSHAEAAEDLVALGRDVERRVLARAVRLVAEDRVILTGHRTVVFD